MEVDEKNDDPKYWEEVVLPNIQRLKAKQKEVALLMDKLEAIAYDKAGYISFSGIWRKMPDNWDAKQWLALKGELNYWKERGTV